MPIHCITNAEATTALLQPMTSQMSSTIAVNFEDAKIPAHDSSVDEYLRHIVPGLEHIMDGNSSFCAYTSLYTTLFNYFHSCPMTQRDSERAGRLYNIIKDALACKVRPIAQEAKLLQDVDLMHYYVEQWSLYNTRARRLDHMLDYLNRYYVRSQWFGVYDIYTLALIQWQKELSNAISRLVPFALLWVTQLRMGHVDHKHAESREATFLNSLASLARRPRLPWETTEFYKDIFEAPFLKEAGEYYERLARESLSTLSTYEYAKVVEEQFLKEEDIADCLPDVTSKEMISKCEETLMRGPSERMLHCFRISLEDKKAQEVRCLYAVLKRIPEALEPMQSFFGEYVDKTIQSAHSQLEDEMSRERLDPKTYVNLLLALYNENAELVTYCFNGRQEFSSCLDKSFCKFVNDNVVTKARTTRSLELMIKYADAVLRKEVDEDKAKKELDNIVLLSKYVNDKDVFQASYENLLSKRLLYSTSTSQGAEKFMISKFKAVHGLDFTRKLERMMTDIDISEELTNSFKASEKRSQKLSFSIKVLSALSWKLSVPDDHFVIPNEMASTYCQFQQFYCGRHTGRKLKWLLNHSNNDLMTNYLDKNYIFVTSSCQAAVLLLYNGHDSLSLPELLEGTGLSQQLLVRILGLLQNARVLIKREDRYDLNFEFRSKKTRVNINSSMMVKAEDESPRIPEENRSHTLKAVIVRIMKAKKTLKTEALVQEVILQVSQLFVPKVSDIREAIGKLLELEYISDDGGAGGPLVYIP